MTTEAIAVPVYGDTTVEQNEYFWPTLLNPVNPSYYPTFTSVSIWNDDTGGSGGPGGGGGGSMF